MPKFKYTALGADGAQVTGVEVADTQAAARVAIRERKLSPLDVTEKKSILQFEITRKRVPRKELMHFSRQMGAFVRAGIPILDALEVMSEEMGNKLFKAALLDMAEALRSGDTFADAAERHPEAFPPFYRGILRSAELTGNLDTVLAQLSEYIERDLEARRKISSALIYPAMVMSMSVVTIAVLTIFVMPRFEKFFASFDAELPLITRILLNFTEFMSNWWFVFAGLALAVVVFLLVGVRTQRGRDLRDRMLLSAPVLGDLVQHAILERFCRILSSMVSAGVPLPEAMAVTGEATNNAVYRGRLALAREAMMRGEGLAGPLTATELFPAAARQMFRVGEDTGTLDEQLNTAAVYFDRELDYKIKRFTDLFEPAVIIVVGIVVGFVAIALVSAMYGIFDKVNVA